MDRSVEAAIGRVAAGQQRNITAQQLRRLGLDHKAVARRRWLFRTYGVYTVGHPPETWHERAAAAVLACGEGAALSHYSALALWGWATRWPRQLDVTVAGDRNRPTIRIHRSTKLLARDFRTREGIRVTSPARTVLDAAPSLSEGALKRAINEALLSKHLRRPQLKDIIERFPRHPGARRLKPFIDAKGGPTRSAWEDGFPSFCKKYGLPEPVMSARVAGYEVDALFPDEKVIVELDSWKFHSSRESFESDRDGTPTRSRPTTKRSGSRGSASRNGPPERRRGYIRSSSAGALPKPRPSPSGRHGSRLSPAAPQSRRRAPGRPSR